MSSPGTAIEKVATSEPLKTRRRPDWDYDVDENVLSALPISGTRVEYAKRYGDSLWGLHAKIDCRTPDGKAVTYFQKAIEHRMSAHMIKGDFESLKALNSISPDLAPRPYVWGSFKRNPACHFMLMEFRDVAKQLPEPVKFGERIAELHERSVSPTGKFGFHLKTMVGPILHEINGWSDSWEEVFSNLLGNFLDIDSQKGNPWPEFEHIKHLIKVRVIPRLLRPLQSDGRSIKPCLVHGNLWDGNTATDRLTGEPFISDPQCLYAHNEYEIGDWRLPRHYLSSPEYALEYIRNFPISEPLEDWDSRNILYSLTYNTSAAVLYPKMNQRAAIYESMEELCTRYCHQELLARLKGDTIPVEITSPVPTTEEDDLSEGEEPE